jgi:hypothetical protein
MKPNIFNLATSELSQDGFFTWLLQWADNQTINFNPNLSNCAKDFTNKLINKQLTYNRPISNVNAGRQWENIDIWAEVNEEILIIIEDKVQTSEHSNQLERYKEIASNWCKEHNYQLVCIYLKTGIESNSALSAIQSKGFAIIDRKELITFFNSHTNIISDIFTDFKERLIQIENSSNSFETLKIKEWGWDSWQGFYQYLETKIDVEDWKYISNPMGGFLGLWWHFLKWEDFRVYLQIEQGNLCFKIGEVYENQSEVRNEWFGILINKAQSYGYTEIQKPNRFGKGNYMTVAIVERDNWLGKADDIINHDWVLNNLKKYEGFLTNCLK